jgi:hypothetical protein
VVLNISPYLLRHVTSTSGTHAPEREEEFCKMTKSAERLKSKTQRVWMKMSAYLLRLINIHGHVEYYEEDFIDLLVLNLVDSKGSR